MAQFPKNLSGFRFGRWTVLAFAPPFAGETRLPLWCRCDCGREKIVRRCSLINGSSRSCGCLLREGHNNRRHSLSGSSTYQTWIDMRRRCEQPQNKNFARYGGRGIAVCDRWRQSFEAFVEDMGLRPDGKSLDRKDGDGPYSPENCRWATQAEQQNNRRSNRPLTWRGETHNLGIWAAKVGLSPSTLRQRLGYVSAGLPGWTLDECMTRPKPAHFYK